MVPGNSLEEKIELVDRIGYDGIELHEAETLKREPADLVEVFRGQRVRPTTIDGARQLLSPDPSERSASMALLKTRLQLCARLDAVAVLLVPIFGRPLVADLSPVHTAVELENQLLT